MPSALEQISTFLQTQLGLTPVQAAGVEGNFQVESGFNPSAYNPNEGAVGIAQWEKGRRTELQQLARQRGTAETDLGTQLAFLQWELEGPDSTALAALKATSDPGTAAAVFDQDYERSAGTSRAKRVADAQAIASGNPTAGGSAGGGSGGGSIASSLGGGLFTGWAPTAFTIGLKVLGVAAGAGLVIVGAVHTVSK